MVRQRGHLMARSMTLPFPNSLLQPPHRISCISNFFTGCAAACYARPTLGRPGEGAAGESRWTGVPAPGQWDGACRPACSAYPKISS